MVIFHSYVSLPEGMLPFAAVDLPVPPVTVAPWPSPGKVRPNCWASHRPRAAPTPRTWGPSKWIRHICRYIYIYMCNICTYIYIYTFIPLYIYMSIYICIGYVAYLIRVNGIWTGNSYGINQLSWGFIFLKKIIQHRWLSGMHMQVYLLRHQTSQQNVMGGRWEYLPSQVQVTNELQRLGSRVPPRKTFGVSWN